jgi:hypothetical protein
MNTVYDKSQCNEELNQKALQITKYEDVNFLYVNEIDTHHVEHMTSWEDIVALLYKNEVETLQIQSAQDDITWDDVVTLLYENEFKTKHIPLDQTITLCEDKMETQ